MKENETLKGRINIEYLDKYTVQMEVDNAACQWLIEVLTDLMSDDPDVHHVNYDAGTGYDLGVMTKNSLGLIINNRDKY